MDIIHTISDLRHRLKSESSIGFAPTMGNLHAGHLQLVSELQKKSNCQVVSLFVNRLQFGAHEDFNQYPRTLEQDCVKLEEMGCHVVYIPAESEIYPTEQMILIDHRVLTHELEGAIRPGHFSGMLTIVMKLFQIVHPQVVAFGQKDFQQTVLVRQLIEQLSCPIELLMVPTFRASDGLALSSRNGYLTPDERQKAPQLYRQILHIETEIKAGKIDFLNMSNLAQQTLDQMGWQTDYIRICHPKTLKASTPEDQNWVILGASRLGKTRLIDNILTKPPHA